MVPISLELNNFFSHKASFIDFTLFDSALLIGNTEGNYDLSNGSGKSAIFESIAWVLFNKARVAAIDDIILWGEESCYVIMHFTQGDTKYKVKRTRSRVDSSSFVEFSYLSVDDDWIDISGSTSGLTNDKIVSVIKFDYKTFINSAYFRQNDISEFAESDPGRKKEILKSIIDLSKWDEYEKEAKFRLKNIKSEFSLLQAKVEELEVDELDLSKFQSQLNTLNAELKKSQQTKTDLAESLDRLSLQYRDLKSNLDTEQWDKLQLENDDIKKQAARIQEALKKKKDECDELDSKISKNKSLIFDIEEKLKEIEVDNDIEIKSAAILDNIITYKTKLSTANSMLDKLQKNPLVAGICNVCEQEISDELVAKLSHQHQAELDAYKKESIFAKNKLQECEEINKKYDLIKFNNKRAEGFIAKVKMLINENLINKSTLADRTKEKQNLAADLGTLKSRFEANTQIISSLKNDDFQNLLLEINKMKAQSKELDDKVGEKNREIGVVFQKISDLNTKVGTMKKDRELLIDINKKQSSYERLSKLLGKNGIQTILLNAVIEDLEKTANNILTSICNEPLCILLETQRIGSDGVSIVDTLDLKVRKDGFIQNFKSLSGGEQFRISLSLRIALSEISSRHSGSSLEFLLLDEINSPLDNHGTQNLFVNVIRSLEKKYKILVITHNELLKEKFDNILDVTKINGESTTIFAQK